MNSLGNSDRRPAVGWSKALLLAILWFVVGVVPLVPLLLVQAKLFQRNDWGVSGFSTAELVQVEFFAAMVTLGLILGWLYRSWRILILLSAFAIAGAFLIGGLMFVLDPPFIGI